MSTEPDTQPSEAMTELEEIVVRPGTYFNPQTEVLVTVDDSASIDQTIFNMEAYEGADWVRISDEVAIDEERRDEILESFQAQHHPDSAHPISETALEPGDDEVEREDTAEDGAGADPVIEGEAP